jgi:hypothetical protein
VRRSSTRCPFPNPPRCREGYQRSGGWFMALGLASW